MKRTWLSWYIPLMGGFIALSGLLLAIRSVVHHHTQPGLILGITLIVYGFLRIYQRKKLFVRQ